MIYQYDDKKIVIMGDSAGGGLAAAFCGDKGDLLSGCDKILQHAAK